MSDSKRRRFSSEEKSKAVRRLLRGDTPQDVADDIGATANQVTRWETRFMEAGDFALTKSSRKKTDWGKAVQWAGLVAVLLVTILALTRFLGQPGQ